MNFQFSISNLQLMPCAGRQAKLFSNWQLAIGNCKSQE